MKISTGRVELAAALAGWLPTTVGVIDHLPDSIAPPCVLVSWSDPWIRPSTLCAYQASMELVVIAQRIEPGGKLETLEEIIATILPNLKSLPEWQTVDVTAPYPIQVGGVDYLAASVNITYDMEDDT